MFCGSSKDRVSPQAVQELLVLSSIGKFLPFLVVFLHPCAFCSFRHVQVPAVPPAQTLFAAADHHRPRPAAAVELHQVPHRLGLALTTVSMQLYRRCPLLA